MDTIEVSARNSGEAIRQALAQLGIGEDEAEITIIQEGSRGILGIGAEDARVRVTRRAPPLKPAPQRTPRAPRAPEPPAVEQPASTVQPAPVLAPPPPPAAEASAGQLAPSAMTVGQVSTIAHQVLVELLQAMGINGRVNLRNVANRLDEPLDGDNPIVLDIVGDDLGILIGRRGETLSALQLVTNLIVGRRTKEWARIVVDVEGYRLRREETLRSLAARMAERVRYSRTPFTMEAMPAHERRIVHMSLKDNEYVTTESHGEGEERRVTISPRR